MTDFDAITPAPDFRLDGRHALVTGAGRGIGRACAHGLAQAGATVTLAARSAGDLERVAAEIEQIGSRAFPVVCDVRDPAAVAAAVGQAFEHGPLSVLVNSAGLNRPGPAADFPLDDWDLLMETNVRGTFVACQQVARRWLADGTRGSIVNISSQLGRTGFPNRAPYSASKHAVDGLTRSLGVEWAPHGIRVNSVGPTFILTPMTAPFFENKEFEAEVLRRIPLGRLGALEEVSSAVVFLASDAASLITGQCLQVDGGWTAI